MVERGTPSDAQRRSPDSDSFSPGAAPQATGPERKEAEFLEMLGAAAVEYKRAEDAIAECDVLRARITELEAELGGLYESVAASEGTVYMLRRYIESNGGREYLEALEDASKEDASARFKRPGVLCKHSPPTTPAWTGPICACDAAEWLACGEREKVEKLTAEAARLRDALTALEDAALHVWHLASIRGPGPDVKALDDLSDALADARAARAVRGEGDATPAVDHDHKRDLARAIEHARLRDALTALVAAVAHWFDGDIPAYLTGPVIAADAALGEGDGQSEAAADRLLELITQAIDGEMQFATVDELRQFLANGIGAGPV